MAPEDTEKRILSRAKYVLFLSVFVALFAVAPTLTGLQRWSWWTITQLFWPAFARAVWVSYRKLKLGLANPTNSGAALEQAFEFSFDMTLMNLIAVMWAFTFPAGFHLLRI
jgi:hypothetical protein